MAALELWYRRPAAVWTEALPIGNGRLGAMVFGDASREQLQINESSFFNGGPYQPTNPEAREYLPRVRELIFAGRYAEAEAMARDHMMARPYLQTSFHPIGDVWMQFPRDAAATSYRRSLDLDSAVATTRYEIGGVAYTREAFVSPVSGVLVYAIGADRPGAVDVDLELTSPQPGAARPPQGAELRFSGTNQPEHGIPAALRFGFAARVKAEGGELVHGPQAISVRGADRVLVLVDAATSFRRFDDVGGDPEAEIDTRLSAAAARTYDELKSEHLIEHRRLFRCLSLDLGGGSALPTDERIGRYTADEDPGLVSLFVQYGRYLMLSSSRPGTQPANLQGLWNDQVRPPWGSKYTTNINLEMNYWLPDPANLAECFEPLLALVEDIAVTGAETARFNYGARGWVLHHNTDLWRATGPIDGPQWGMWPMGGAWLCAQLWDHYQFAPSPDLLRRIYPLLRGAVEFLLDYLVPDPVTGALVTVPSLSPENQHPFGAAICAGPAMDMQILRDLFAATIAAASQLGVDPQLVERMRGARRRLNPDRIGKAGQLQEWAEDWDLDVPEPLQRHVSHLYAVYPSQQINPDDTPELLAAARRSLELRGDEATGWGIGWRLNLWARMREGEHAAAVLKLLLSPARSYPNLFDAHPPFQIDGNFGGAAGVLEMLVQSTPDSILLLPALPARWAEGRLDGVRVRGGISLDLSWHDSRPDRVKLRAVNAYSGTLRFGQQDVPVTLERGQELILVLREGTFMPAGERGT